MNMKSRRQTYATNPLSPLGAREWPKIRLNDLVSHYRPDPRSTQPSSTCRTEASRRSILIPPPPFLPVLLPPPTTPNKKKKEKKAKISWARNGEGVYCQATVLTVSHFRTFIALPRVKKSKQRPIAEVNKNFPAEIERLRTYFLSI